MNRGAAAEVAGGKFFWIELLVLRSNIRDYHFSHDRVVSLARTCFYRGCSDKFSYGLSRVRMAAQCKRGFAA
jgi:hypothetical protein